MPGLPDGTVTFLFTDIEGSTQLLHQLGAAYAEVLNAQKLVLRSAFAARNGHEVDNQGDSFFYAFANAPDALAAAVDAQRALATHSWTQNVQVRVRMGLHTGKPILSNERYVGVDVHRAARVGAAGSGGQIILTQETYDAAREQLPNGVSLRDLGAVRLKDLKKPEHVFQIVALDLPSDFPPLKGLDALDAHLDAVLKALGENRLVIFLGEGVNLFGRQSGKSWQNHDPEILPHGNELAEHLARNFNYPPNAPRDLLHVSQYVSLVTGTGPLYDEMHTLLDADYAPTALHQFLAQLPALLRAQNFSPRALLFVTTNYDDALERAFRAANEAFDLVTYVAEGEARGKFLHRTPEGGVTLIERPNEYRGLAADPRCVILKLHGAVDRETAEWDSFVVTEDHYIDYLARGDISSLIPVTLAAKLRKSHFLFLGYALRDWHLRVILHRLWGQQRLMYKSWAVGAKPDQLELEFWRKRDVESLNVRLEEYVSALGERLGVNA
jgi:class 3 adenylate cyclase